MTLHEETDELARSESGPPIGCRLLVTAGDEDDVGRSVALMRGTAFIGRSSDCELPLKDGRVSRRHVSLAIDHGGITVEDLRSRNGTFYLGSRIERARVPHGASITVGDTTIALLPLAMNDLAASSAPTSYGDLVGESLAMRRVFATLTRLEASDVNVVIVGESGTGKERIARIVHKKSRRTEGPFVAVTCSGADEEGLLHELAGRSGRPGAFERADGGTLYLEDVDALPAPLQTLLARV
ncbi:MAG TPA: FHA domain-containing protein, partial [Myxococcota bacterium]|nr:FHA domain-containing protein [Myxococcota bacterium]